jgi:hypothetical protein
MTRTIFLASSEGDSLTYSLFAAFIAETNRARDLLPPSPGADKMWVLDSRGAVRLRLANTKQRAPLR